MAQMFLLEKAKTFDNHDLQKIANHILEVIDPVGAEEHAGAKLEEEEKRALKRTSLFLQRTADGLTRIKVLLHTSRPDSSEQPLRALPHHGGTHPRSMTATATTLTPRSDR